MSHHKRISEVERHLLEVLPDLTGLIDPLIKIIASYEEPRRFLHDSELYNADADIEFMNDFTAFKKKQGTGFTNAVCAALPPVGRHSIVFRFHGSPSIFSIVGLCKNPKVGGWYSHVGESDEGGLFYCFADHEKHLRWGLLQDPVITMIVDFEEDTLTYLVNGDPYMDPICGRNLKSQSPLYPGATVGDKDNWVEVD